MTDYPHDPSGHPQPQYPQPGYQQPGYEPTQYPQPQYPQPGYQQQYYGGQDPNQLGAPVPPAKPKRTRLLVTTSAVVVVLAAGGVATYAAVSDSGSSGKSSPKSAIQSTLTDLNNSDLLGFVDDLAPDERTALAKPISTLVDSLKKSQVLSSGADASKVGGLTIAAKDFTYAPTTITVNDHVQIVQITGGTLRVSGDASKVPLSKDFLNAVVPGGLHGKQTSTIDIADELKKDGEKSVRVAAEKVDGSWYPSLFYTIADNASHSKGLPTAADAIPAQGASSPQSAVTTLINGLLHGNVDSIVGVLSPDEMAVLHDYGHLILPTTYDSPLRGSAILDPKYVTKDLGGGRTLVSLTSGSFTIDGDHTTFSRQGNCIDTRVNGRPPVHTCAGKASDSSLSDVARHITGHPLTTRQLAAINDVFSGATKNGIVVSQSAGGYFVNPVSTILTELANVAGALKPGDLPALIGLAGN